MTLAPRFLVKLWAGYRANRLARRLKTTGRDRAAQQAALARLMARSAPTAFGRQHGLTAATTYAQFQSLVPPRAYDYFQPLINRMADGEPDVLAPGKCSFFVETAGTTGPAKLLPVPEAQLAHTRDALRDTLLHYTLCAGHNGVFLGRLVHIGASTALREANGAYGTSFDGLLALSLSPWAEANLYSPPPAIARLPDCPEKTLAVARAMRSRDVTLVGGTPAAIGALALDVCALAGPGRPHLQSVWPNLECCLYTGASLGLFRDTLRTALGSTVKLHEVYAAAEGIFAAQDNGPSPGLRLLTDAGIFYEFLPLADYNETTLAEDGGKCLPLEKISAAVDYVPVITTPAGLCRYVLGDIVRFTSVNPPRLLITGRTALRLNLAGEHVGEHELVETLQAVCNRNGWQPVNFHVAPYYQRIAAGQSINCHEWWLELRTHTVKTPTANVLGPELDAELVRRNPDYAARRANRALDFPSVRLVIPGLFAQWAREQGKVASASKMPRCRSDRLIADQLAALARFHQATVPPFTSVEKK